MSNEDLDRYQNEGNMKVSDKEMDNFDGEKCHEIQELRHSTHLFNLCEGIDETFDQYFNQEIDILHAEHCLYDVLLSQNESGDTPLHVAVKNNKVDLAKNILLILSEPYKSDTFYKDKYFKDDKPLSKVINTKNKNGKDVITLAFEVDLWLLPSTVFECSSYDEETTQSLIERCNDEISELRKESVDNDKKSARTKRVLRIAESTSAHLAGASSCIQIFKGISRIVVGVIDVDTTHSYSISGDFLLCFMWLMISLYSVTNLMLSRYKEKVSSLEERLERYINKRDQLESRLHHFKQRKYMCDQLDELSKQLDSIYPQSQNLREEKEKLEREISHLKSVYCSAELD